MLLCMSGVSSEARLASSKRAIPGDVGGCVMGVSWYFLWIILDDTGMWINITFYIVFLNENLSATLSLEYPFLVHMTT